MVKLKYISPQEFSIPLCEVTQARGFGRPRYYSRCCAVVAEEAGEIVGILRGWPESKAVLSAGGTWVAQQYRRSGLAVKMWRLMLRKTAPKRVAVQTISRGGARLVAALMRTFPRIEWEHEVL